MKKKPPQPPKPKRPRGRPIVRVIDPIEATPKEIVKAVFREANRERDEKLDQS